MITKLQKGLLWLFGAMFLVPEILWSPVLNFSYSIWEGKNIPTILRPNFLISSDYRKLAIGVVLIQCLGLVMSLIFILKSDYKIILKTFLLIVVSLLLMLSILVFIFLLATINMGF